MNPFLFVAIGAAIAWLIFGDEKKETKDETLSHDRGDRAGDNGRSEPRPATQVDRRVTAAPLPEEKPPETPPENTAEKKE